MNYQLLINLINKVDYNLEIKLVYKILNWTIKVFLLEKL